MTEESEEFKSGEFRGTVLKELASLKEGQNRVEVSFREFKSGIGERMGKVETGLSAVQGRTELLMWILGKIATPILGAIGAGLVGMIVWHFFKGG